MTKSATFWNMDVLLNVRMVFKEGWGGRDKSYQSMVEVAGTHYGPCRQKRPFVGWWRVLQIRFFKLVGFEPQCIVKSFLFFSQSR
jgi:hypothetical protein